jgi:hypothetical protein
MKQRRNIIQVEMEMEVVIGEEVMEIMVEEGMEGEVEMDLVVGEI